jgi:uncharacterized protein YbjT (DUF2867 family)
VAEKKVIAVIGATGAQGGGLVRAILADPHGEFTARAITRNPESDNARGLSAMGAQVVAADIDNPASIEKAFTGAYGAFCVTFFWDHLSPEKEKLHAKTMAEAARAAGLKHVIWSTLEDTRRWVPLDDNRMPTLMERYKVPHLDAKGEADRYFIESGVPTTLLLTSFYWDNLIHFGMGPKPDQSGTLTFTLPMGRSKLPGIAAEDIGKCAYGIFKAGQPVIGKTVGVAGEHLSGEEMANALARALGRDVRYNEVEPAVYRSFGFPGAEDIGNMFQFKRDFEREYRAPRDVNRSRELNPDLQTFDAWLQHHKERIPIS